MTGTTPASVNELNDLRDELRGRWVDLAVFGGDSSGLADSAPALLLAQETGRNVFIGPGRWLFGKLATNPNLPFRVFGAGQGLTTLVQGYDGQILQALGSAAAALNLTVDATAGQRTLTMASTATLAPGDVLRLKSDLAWPGGTLGSVYGEFVRVRSVDSGTVVTLMGTLRDSYATANTARVEKITDSGRSLAGSFTIENPAPGTLNSSPILCDLVGGVQLDHIETLGLDDSALLLRGCWGFRVNRCDFVDSTSNEGAGRLGYGVEARSGSCHGLVESCTMDNGRHLFTCGSSSGQIPSRQIRVSDCRAYNMKSAAFDSHEDGRDLTFDGCEAHNCFGQGMSVRAPDTTVLDFVAVGCGRGISIYDEGHRAVVRGGRIEAIRRQTGDDDAWGIWVNTADCEIEGVTIRSTGDEGIYADADGDRLTIRDVSIDTPGVEGNDYCIWLEGCDGVRVRDVEVANANTGLRIDAATNVYLRDIRARSVTNRVTVVNGGTRALVAPGAQIPISLGSQWTNMPLASTEVLSTTARRQYVDLSDCVEGRISLYVLTVGVAAAVVGPIEYSLNDGGAWSTLLAGTLSLQNAGSLKSNWEAIPQAARTDVLIRALGSGGDGAADPLFTLVAQVR